VAADLARRRLAAYVALGAQVQIGARSTQAVLYLPGTKNSTNTMSSPPSLRRRATLALVVRLADPSSAPRRNPAEA
jgi:hypothetical protein